MNLPEPPASALDGFNRLPGVFWWVLDRDGTVLRVAPTVVGVLGLVPTAVIQHPFVDMVEPSDVALWQASLARALAGDEVSEVLVRLRSDTVGSRQISWALRQGAAGTTIVALGRDRTDSWPGLARPAEDDEGIVESLLHAMPLPVFVKDLDGRYQFVNPEFCRLAGLWGAPEAIGRKASDIWPGGDPSILANEADAYRRSPQVVAEQMTMAVGTRTYLVARQVVRDASGRPQATVGMGTDVTDRVAAERELDERNSIFEAVLRCCSDTITIVDDQARIVHPGSGRTIENEGQELSFASLVEQVHTDDKAMVSAAFADLWASGTDSAVRYRLVRDDGQQMTMESRARVERDVTGRPRCMVIVTRDLTGVLDTEARLRTALMEAEQASRAKSDLLSRVSHELRTPLNSILGFGQLLQMDGLAPPEVRAVDAVLQAGRSLLSIVDAVLGDARIEAGQVQLRPEAVPWTQLINEIAATADVAPVFGAASHVNGAAPDLNGVSPDGEEVAPDIDGAWPTLWADPRWLRRVLVSLVEVIHMASGVDRGRRVQFTAGVSAGEPGRVRVVLESRLPGGAGAVPAASLELAGGLGAGIPACPLTEPAVASCLHDGEVQAGLNRCQRLVEQMGGDLYLDVVDAAIRAEIDLPGTEPPGSEKAPRKNPSGMLRLAADRPAGRFGLPPLQMLVVSDDTGLAALAYQVTSRRAGVHVRVVPAFGAARHGRHGAWGASGDSADVVVLDLVGATDGPQQLAAWRAGQAAASRPALVVLGAVGGIEAATPYLDGGADAYLSTPVDVLALLELVDAIVPRR